MKLTKQKLEQLIMEQFKSLEQRIFDKRRQRLKEPGLIRAFGDQDQPINRPEYADKLTTLASSGPEGYQQAKIAADSLDEPLDIELDPANMQTMKIADAPKGYHDVDGPYFTHVRYVMWANQNGYPELTFTDEIVPEAVRAFANAEGLDYEETLSSVKFNLSNNKKARIRKALGKFNPDKQVADMYGFDRDPFGNDDF